MDDEEEQIMQMCCTLHHQLS